MPRIVLEFPVDARPGFWLRVSNAVAARNKFARWDESNRWRYAFEGNHPRPPDTGGPPSNPDARSVSFSRLLDRPAAGGFRFLIFGDSGEGDRSQYGLVPLIRALNPEFIIINGDVAYPAGNEKDFAKGLFAPYRGFGIPIWAVPGNHEYYSARSGEEFYEIFCTRERAAQLWEANGLRLVPQPGTYWELREPDGGMPLVVLGVDSGQAAKLEGDRTMPPDVRQHAWLDWRLSEAEKAQAKVIVLFHIPALVKEKHNGKTKLETLHQMIASYSCVRLVVCAHEHNYQQYSAAEFGRYLETEQHAPPSPPYPAYVISGAAGAALGHTDFPGGQYRADSRYPAPEDWKEYASRGRRIVERAGLSKTIVGRIAGGFDKDQLSDSDAAQYLNMLMVEVGADVQVTPVLMNDLEQLYSHLPDGTVVNVMDPRVLPNPAEVNACLRRPIVL